MLKIAVPALLYSGLCLGSITLDSLSLEEKVGQVLMVQFHGQIANEEAYTLIQDTKVGGVIYYNWSNDLSSPTQIRDLSTSLQRLTKTNPHPIPLLLSTDQEGGVVVRAQEGFTHFPGNKALGETSDPSLAKAASFIMGQELKAVGINMNLAPVVDVNSNPGNPIIGIRAFGEDPEKVTAFGKQALEGYQEAGIISTLKHFPGHGDVSVDSHEDLPIIYKTQQELEKVDLLPFARLATSADAIMTAHILVPALDPENCTTLSKKTLSYLREAIGFQGVIISDSLVMESVLKKCHTVDEAAIQALNAGCDILLLGGKLLTGKHTNYELTTTDVKRIHKALVNAVKNGRIPETRLNEATQRILDLKNRYITPRIEENRLEDQVNKKAHQTVAKQIASQSLKVFKNEHQIRLRQKKIIVLAPELLKKTIHQTSLLDLGKVTDSYFFSSLNPSTTDIDTAKKLTQEADAIVVCSYNAWKNPSQIDLIQSLIATKKPVILLVTRDPLDTTLFSEATLIFNTFSPTAVSIQAVCDRLEQSLSLSSQEAHLLGEKVWQNECAGTLEGLTHWHKRENFASLGIGHFIWKPEGSQEDFEETFPLLLSFLQNKGVQLPDWLKNSSGCPWHSYEEFHQDIASLKMNSLRQLLFDTRDLQAVFMTERLENILPLLLNNCLENEKEKISTLFFQLSKEANGLYALLDYLNFKGSGLAGKETYKGQGWGLLQVLQRMPFPSNDLVADFVKSAQFLLRQRVENSPPDRQEEKWLKGWLNRLNTYYITEK